MKSIILKIIIGSVFIAIFNVVFFLSGIPLSDANWCTYAFVMVSYLLLLSTPLLAKGTKSGILEGSLWLRATFYFITELVIAAICLYISPATITWPLIAQGVFLSVFLILQLMSVLANDATVASISQQRELSFSKRSLIDQLQISLQGVDDPNMKAQLNRCIDIIENSPLQTCPEAYDADMKITEAVNEICFTVTQGEINLVKQKTNVLMQAVQNKNLIVKRYRQ